MRTNNISRVVITVVISLLLMALAACVIYTIIISPLWEYSVLEGIFWTIIAVIAFGAFIAFVIAVLLNDFNN